MSLADKLRSRLTPALWERAEVYAREGGAGRAAASPTEERWIVRIAGRAAPFEVLLWPKDEEWSCSCELEACAHAAAAVIARASGKAVAVQAPPIRYRFERKKTGLVLHRDVPADAIRTEADQELNRRLAGWWGKENLPKGLLADALGLLDGAPCTLDGAGIHPKGTPVSPLALVADKDAGFVVRLVRPPGIDEAFPGGFVRLGDTLRAYVEIGRAHV